MVKHTQTIRRLFPKNCLSVFDQFVGLAPKGLNSDYGNQQICDLFIPNISLTGIFNKVSLKTNSQFLINENSKSESKYRLLFHKALKSTESNTDTQEGI